MPIFTVARQFPEQNKIMIKRGLWAAGVACLLCLLCGLFLPADWVERFGVLAWPLELMARLPAIQSFAEASRVPNGIVSGFLGLLCWVHLLLALYFAYWQNVVRQEDGARGFLALWSDEALCFHSSFSAWPVFVYLLWEWGCFLWRAMQATPQAWREAPLAGNMVHAMLDERGGLLVWGSFCVLPWATLMFVVALNLVSILLILCLVMPPPPKKLASEPKRLTAMRRSALAELATLARTASSERQADFAAVLKEGDMDKLHILALLYATARESRAYRGIAWEIWRHALKPWQQAELERLKKEAEREALQRYQEEKVLERQARIRRELKDWAEKDAELRSLHFAAIRSSGDKRALKLLGEVYEAAKDQQEYQELARQLFQEIVEPERQGETAADRMTQGQRDLSDLLMRQVRRQWRLPEPPKTRSREELEESLKLWAGKEEMRLEIHLDAIRKSGTQAARQDILELYEVARDRAEYRDLAKQIFRRILEPVAPGLIQLALYRMEQSEERQARIRRELKDWAEKDEELRRMHLAAILASEDERAIGKLADLYEAAEGRPEYQALAEDIAQLVLAPWYSRSQTPSC